MRTDLYKAIPGDATDPEGLTALLERYLLWMETHHSHCSLGTSTGSD